MLLKLTVNTNLSRRNTGILHSILPEFPESVASVQEICSWEFAASDVAYLCLVHRLESRYSRRKGSQELYDNETWRRLQV